MVEVTCQEPLGKEREGVGYLYVVAGGTQNKPSQWMTTPASDGGTNDGSHSTSFVILPVFYVKLRLFNKMFSFQVCSRLILNHGMLKL